MSTETQKTDQEVAESIALSCRNDRINQGMTATELAKRANVAYRTVSQIENSTSMVDLCGQLRNDATLRNRRIWARSFSRVSLALGRQPEDWLQMMEFKLPRYDIENIIQKARSEIIYETIPGLDSGVSHEDYWTKICFELSSEKKESIEVPTGLLKFGVFCSPDNLKNSLFYTLAARIFRIIHPRLKLYSPDTECINEFKTLIEGLTSRTPKYRLTFGLLNMVARRRLGIRSIPIPGFRIRLSFLTTPESAQHLTWRDVAKAPETQNYSIRVMTDAGEAADIYLRGCGFEKPHIEIYKYYEPLNLAKEFEKKIRQPDTNTKWVLVTDELAAMEIQTRLKNLEIDTVDLGCTSNKEVPSYSIAIATRQQDAEWAQTIQSIFQDEMFHVYSSEVTEIYAEFFKVALDFQRKCIYQMEKEGTVWWAESMPSYLQLDDFGSSIRRSERFCIQVKDKLISHLEEDCGFIGGRDQITPFVSKMIPQMTSDELGFLRNRIESLEEILGDKKLLSDQLEKIILALSHIHNFDKNSLCNKEKQESMKNT